MRWFLGAAAVAALVAIVIAVPTDEAPAVRSVVEHETPVTPEACADFIGVADRFVGVTNDVLAAQNRGLGAVIDSDADGLAATVATLKRAQKSYDKVTDRYLEMRDACLLAAG